MTDWPSNGDLRVLEREANEHRRAWGVVSGLVQTLREERDTRRSQQSAEYRERIHKLEGKIRSQREHLSIIEECREFERETEHRLADTLINVLEMIDNGEKKGFIYVEVDAALVEYQRRKGPRTIENPNQEAISPTIEVESCGWQYLDFGGVWISCDECTHIYDDTGGFLAETHQFGPYCMDAASLDAARHAGLARKVPQDA